MKKWSFLVIAVLLLALACTLPSIAINNPPASSTPSVTCRPPEPVSGTLSGMTVVRLVPEGGDLVSQLVIHAAAASALGQHMFVEFDASW